MDKSLFLKWLLIILLLASCGLDIYATISDSNFLVLEGNFAVHMIGSIWPILIFKIIFCIGLCVALSMPALLAKSNFSKYFYIHIIVLLIFLQIMAGVNNLIAKQEVTEYINVKTNSSYAKPSEVPAEVIKENVALPKEMASTQYIGMMARVFYLPFALGLLSFWLWENIFWKPKKEEDEWKVILEGNEKCS